MHTLHQTCCNDFFQRYLYVLDYTKFFFVRAFYVLLDCYIFMDPYYNYVVFTFTTVILFLCVCSYILSSLRHYIRVYSRNCSCIKREFTQYLHNHGFVSKQKKVQTDTSLWRCAILKRSDWPDMWALAEARLWPTRILLNSYFSIYRAIILYFCLYMSMPACPSVCISVHNMYSNAYYIHLCKNKSIYMYFF